MTDPLERQIDKILKGWIKEEAKTRLIDLVRGARVDELKELMSYDWYGTDDSGNENVYFNDEICEYAKARIAQLNSQDKGAL